MKFIEIIIIIFALVIAFLVIIAWDKYEKSPKSKFGAILQEMAIPSSSLK